MTERIDDLVLANILEDGREIRFSYQSAEEYLTGPLILIDIGARRLFWWCRMMSFAYGSVVDIFAAWLHLKDRYGKLGEGEQSKIEKKKKNLICMFCPLCDGRYSYDFVSRWEERDDAIKCVGIPKKYTYFIIRSFIR